MDRGAKPARANAAAKRPRRQEIARDRRRAAIRELETRLAAALEQQAATSEILRLMAASPGDVQPVLDAVAERAARLCKAPFARVFLVDGDHLDTVADYSVDGESPIPRRPDRAQAHHGQRPRGDRRRDHSPCRHRCRCSTPNSPMPRKRSADRVPRRARGAADARRRRVRRDLPVAARARTLRAGSGRAGADVCPTGRDRDRERAAVQGVAVRNRDLTEALEQQEATSEILRAIARSRRRTSSRSSRPLRRTRARLCGAPIVRLIVTFDGDAAARARAAVGVSPSSERSTAHPRRRRSP